MDPIIELDQVSYTYENAAHPALQQVSLTVAAHQWVAIVGLNGSGKSTLAHILDGLLPIDTGTIKIGGQPLTTDNLWQMRQQIGMIFQNPDHQFVGATVEDDVAFGLENQGMPRDQMQQRVHWALEQVKMTAFAHKAPQTLSGGQKQRVAIAGVIALQPRIIIMDESTSMLDPTGREDILRIMQDLQQQLQITILSITHSMAEIVQADQIVILQAGQIIKTGTVEQIFSNLRNLTELGLQPPFTQQLQADLRAAGVPVTAQYHNKSRLIRELCQLRLKM